MVVGNSAINNKTALDFYFVSSLPLTTLSSRKLKGRKEEKIILSLAPSLQFSIEGKKEEKLFCLLSLSPNVTSKKCVCLSASTRSLIQILLCVSIEGSRIIGSPFGQYQFGNTSSLEETIRQRQRKKGT